MSYTTSSHQQIATTTDRLGGSGVDLDTADSVLISYRTPIRHRITRICVHCPDAISAANTGAIRVRYFATGSGSASNLATSLRLNGGQALAAGAVVYIPCNILMRPGSRLEVAVATAGTASEGDGLECSLLGHVYSERTAEDDDSEATSSYVHPRNAVTAVDTF